MGEVKTFPLQNVRTDGWFERIGETVGSFQALCDIIDERFFAFSMITGARITSLTVDRRVPDNTIVEFVIGGDDDDVTADDVQRAALSDFRRRLVHALVGEEPLGPPPKRETDVEAIQLHVGVRYLLLAPLYGYVLKELRVDGDGSQVIVRRDSSEQTYGLEAFQAKLRGHVLKDLERVNAGRTRSSIDLSQVAEASSASEEGNYPRVIELLGGWIAPLTIFLRTPEGATVSLETRATICRALSLLGQAYTAQGQPGTAEDVLRLGIQFAGETSAAPDIFVRLGMALLADGRPGEAIAPLRRAANLGETRRAWLPLARAFLARDHLCAALGALEEGRFNGGDDEGFAAVTGEVADKLGDAYTLWNRELHG